MIQSPREAPALGQAPAGLLFLHGWGASGAAWTLVARELGREFAVLCPDFPGHGAAPPPADPAECALPALAARAADLAGREGPGPFIACGWSLGGLVLLEMLRRRPPGLRGAAFVSCGARFLGGKDFPAGARPGAFRRLRALAQRDFRAGLAAFRGLLLSPAERGSAPGALLSAGEGAGPPPDAAAALFLLDELARADYRDFIGKIDIPCLVLHGTADEVWPEAAGRALAAGIPGARFLPLAGAGHLPFATRRAEFAAALREFAPQCLGGSQ